jgi:superfamily II DNA or RNA helicase
VTTPYVEFLQRKAIVNPPTGLAGSFSLNPLLFDWQADIVRWALRRGRAAIFADCGLGKTFMQLEWARCIPGRVLILTPLAVAQQTVKESVRFGIESKYLRADNKETRIVVTNYEMLSAFAPDDFTGIVLDESSILKSYEGKTRNLIIESFRDTPFRLACTATPAPNDFMELGNHSEFLGTLSRAEMLATFFVHDSGKTQDWRLKGHAEKDFWRWMASWAVYMRKPSDLGYTDNGYQLPPINYRQITTEAKAPEGMLFAVEARGIKGRLSARGASLKDRVAACAEIVSGRNGDQWLIWCNLNLEADALVRSIDGAEQIKGSDTIDEKERRMSAFTSGELKILVTKPSIAGHGMNWQQCHSMAFVGLSDSWEQYYQAVRRCWRFGQTKPVDVYVIVSNAEGAIVKNIHKKELDAARMASGIVEHSAAEMKSEIHGQSKRSDVYATDTVTGVGWAMHLGDCVDVVSAMPAESIAYSVFSPPFASLYTYSATERDMGNCRRGDEFSEHFSFLITELFRVMASGRVVSVHCMNLPSSKAFDGYIGLRDFRGDIIRLFVGAGFIYHSEVCIWKDPVTAMQRTKALGLLHRQLKKDSTMSRMGIPDYVCTFRKPGENQNRVEHTKESYPVSEWQKVASPIWTDIRATETLQFRSARENEDERHIAPLQLEVIRRCLRLWSNPGDLVLSPFAGIGSEGYVSLEMDRQFVGVELKRSYFQEACKNLKNAARQQSLF